VIDLVDAGAFIPASRVRGIIRTGTPVGGLPSCRDRFLAGTDRPTERTPETPKYCAELRRHTPGGMSRESVTNAFRRLDSGFDESEGSYKVHGDRVTASGYPANEHTF
jgi:hypothetical protein